VQHCSDDVFPFSAVSISIDCQSFCVTVLFKHALRQSWVIQYASQVNRLVVHYLYGADRIADIFYVAGGELGDGNVLVHRGYVAKMYR